ncbi:zinc metalloproteinase-disintegrin-like ohanin [Ambystoma mexicanum]|uniref:zinc metalloproteinase-disintegrin-like ohanin n=1 Tax=Ambystoma mexicanum TaxID=8296 RepID=UPI0037E9AE58
MAGILLLLFLIKCQVSSQSSLPAALDYEVVYPQELHPKYKRGIEARYPDVVQYELNLEGEKQILHLEKTADLIASDYTETFYLSDGQPVTTIPQNLEHCYYQGHVTNVNGSSVSVSTCNGLSGLVKMHGQRYVIQPLQHAERGEHAAYKSEHLKVEPKVCGVTVTPAEDVPEPPVMDNKEEQHSFQKQQFLEVFIVADNSMFKKYKEDTEAIKQRIFEMVNHVNMVYKIINTFVALIGLEIWTNRDLITVVPETKDTLSSFARWRRTDLLKRKTHDNAQFLTNMDFKGNTIGLAYLGQMCSTHQSCGVIQDHSTPPALVAATIAHEMGHNLGMEHDKAGCNCSSGRCIMSTTLSTDAPREFSDCSLQNLKTFLSSPLAKCMSNKPSRTKVMPKALCGNNFVEVGEECDCGTEQECENKCCDAKTCKLKPGGVCADGACCHDCQIKSAGDVCRPVKDECDLPDSCDGQSPECPQDRFQKNGYPCKNGKGYCYMGSCPTLLDQCIALWGKGAKLSEKSCFRVNHQGSYYGYCIKKGDKYIACKRRHVMCGKLYCSGGSGMPAYGSFLRFEDCKTSFPDEPGAEDKAMVANGTKCGESLVCQNGECVNMSTTYQGNNCSAKCKVNEVCQNGECVNMTITSVERSSLANCKVNEVCANEESCQCQEGSEPPDFEKAAILSLVKPVPEASPSSEDGAEAA